MMKVIREFPEEYHFVANMRVCDTQSKHIALNTPLMHATEFEKRSKAIGYPFCYMSNGNTFDAYLVASYISNMHHNGFSRPAKYVLASDNRVWADNTHTSLLHVYQNGPNVMIGRTNFYIVDIRSTMSKLVLCGQKIDPAHYASIEQNAKQINLRLDQRWRPRPLTYTILDLIYYDNFLERISELNT